MSTLERRMKRMQLAMCSFAAATCVVASAAAVGQDYPSKPIRMVTGSAGGGQDFAARVIAQGISPALGQQIIIDNRGGNAAISADVILRAPPDGYTLLVTAAPHWLLPFMRDNVSYDPVKDFTPITLAVRVPSLLVVHPSVG